MADTGSDSTEWDLKYLMPDLAPDQLSEAAAEWRKLGLGSPMDADATIVASFMRRWPGGGAHDFASV